MGVKAGDKVLFGKYSGQEFKVNGEDSWSCAKKTSSASSADHRSAIRIHTQAFRRNKSWQPKTSASAKAPATAWCAA